MSVRRYQRNYIHMENYQDVPLGTGYGTKNDTSRDHYDYFIKLTDEWLVSKEKDIKKMSIEDMSHAIKIISKFSFGKHRILIYEIMGLKYLFYAGNVPFFHGTYDVDYNDMPLHVIKKMFTVNDFEQIDTRLGTIGGSGVTSFALASKKDMSVWVEQAKEWKYQIVATTNEVFSSDVLELISECKNHVLWERDFIAAIYTNANRVMKKDDAMIGMFSTIRWGPNYKRMTDVMNIQLPDDVELPCRVMMVIEKDRGKEQFACGLILLLYTPAGKEVTYVSAAKMNEYPTLTAELKTRIRDIAFLYDAGVRDKWYIWVLEYISVFSTKGRWRYHDLDVGYKYKDDHLESAITPQSYSEQFDKMSFDEFQKHKMFSKKRYTDKKQC